jgi:hypothetical protein
MDEIKYHFQYNFKQIFLVHKISITPII